MPEVYVRGSTIKYLRIPETVRFSSFFCFESSLMSKLQVVDLVKNEVHEVRRQQKDNQRLKRTAANAANPGRGGGRGGGPSNRELVSFSALA